MVSVKFGEQKLLPADKDSKLRVVNWKRQGDNTD